MAKTLKTGVSTPPFLAAIAAVGDKRSCEEALANNQKRGAETKTKISYRLWRPCPSVWNCGARRGVIIKWPTPSAPTIAMCKRWPNWSVNHPKAHQRRDPENQTPPNGNLLSFTLLFLVTLFLAYANGANDNFKGVATLYGSQATTFRTALIIGTVSTLAGSICSLFLAEALVKAFSGKGLVPDEISMSSNFLLAVATGAATTVFVTALVGLPISTTHALIGALTGAGLIAAGAQVNFSMLGAKFVLPLLLSPLACILITMPVYRLGQMVSARLGLKKESYLHISPGKLVPTRGLAFETGTAGYWSGEKRPKDLFQ